MTDTVKRTSEQSFVSPMNENYSDPPPWKDEDNHARFAERTAGETIRSIQQTEPLTPIQYARIAAQIRAVRPRRLYRLLPIAAAFLLGIATTASASYLKLLPSWLVAAKSKPVEMVPYDSPLVQTPSRTKSATQVIVHVPTEEQASPEVLTVPPDQPPTESSPGKEISVIPAPAIVPAARRPARKLVDPVSIVDTRKNVATPPSLELGSNTLAPPSHPSNESVAQLAIRENSSSAPRQNTQLARVDTPTTSAPTAAQAAPSTEKPKEIAPSTGTKSAGGSAKHLGDVISLLRVKHDPKAALALLDRHGSDLIKGAFGHEALILRVEALLTLGRQGEVLQLLDGAALTDVAASHLLLITRGNLRAADHRCAEGVGDFDLVLAQSRQPERQALLGRALCRQQLGDSAGAQADLERYRREFPADSRLDDLERRLGTKP